MTAFSVRPSAGYTGGMAESLWDVVIVGGGPAGLLSAGLCSRLHKSDGSPIRVLLLEQSDRLGRKLLLTGSGRCNISNIGGDLLEESAKEPAILQEARAIANCYHTFPSETAGHFDPIEPLGPARDLLTLFSRQPPSWVARLLGAPQLLDIELVEQEAGRLFPKSDSAREVRDALERFALAGGVEIRCNSRVAGLREAVSAEGGLRGIEAIGLADGTRIAGRRFILATGGCNYPQTGASGDGYQWLKNLGLEVLEPWPALVPIQTKENWPALVAGLALSQAGLSVCLQSPASGGKSGRVLPVGKSMLGPLLFTHRGVSGPLILNASAWLLRLARLLPGSPLAGSAIRLLIDTQVSISRETLLQTLDRDCLGQPRRMVKTWIATYLTQALAEVIVEKLCGLAKDSTLGHLPRQSRLDVVESLKALPLHYAGHEGYDTAISTAGGLQPREIDWKTMACKQIDNLHMLGDLLSLDRRSGGYSLLLCWAGAVAAARGCEKSLGCTGLAQLFAGLE